MHLFKHDKNTDVAMQVMKRFYISEDDTYKIKIRWWNIVNPANVFYTGVQETIRIDRKKFLKEWNKYDPT